MTFGQSIKTCFSQYATFSGRASRSEYWWWVLFQNLIILPFYVTVMSNNFMAVLWGEESIGSTTASGGALFAGIILSILCLGLFLPSLAVLFRRLHDSGRSGWWFLISLVPFVGSIILFVFTLLPTQPMENRYGPIPEGVYPYMQ